MNDYSDQIALLAQISQLKEMQIFCLRNAQFYAFLPYLFQRKYILEKSRIFIYTFFFVDHQNIYFNFFFRAPQNPNIYLFIFLFFFWKNIYLLKKRLLSGRVLHWLEYFLRKAPDLFRCL